MIREYHNYFKCEDIGGQRGFKPPPLYKWEAEPLHNNNLYAINGIATTYNYLSFNQRYKLTIVTWNNGT